ncbi:hypothetical protein [Rhodoferax sp. GW822-FHT02A01]|uniref:hypothetical protein n=1 Tax=Rhodoferax sp. GW822-FHT02A01 TaxID=3141537 RepID=UPI00315CB685
MYTQAKLFLKTYVGALTLLMASTFPTWASADEMPTKGEAVIKTLLENDKVLVRETSWKPGQVRASEALANRVVRVMRGGTLLREYPDGKTQKITFKVGEVKWFDVSNASTTAYSVRNVGKTDVVLYTVIVK